MTHNDELEAMVRDFTQVGPRPKSEVRRRISDYVAAEVRKALGEVKDKVMPRIGLDADEMATHVLRVIDAVAARYGGGEE